MAYAIVAFDGFSLVGKTTLSEMLHHRNPDSVVIRENIRDPIRPFTSKLNLLYQDPRISYRSGLELLASEYPQMRDLAEKASRYVSSLDMEGPDMQKKKQASLAYFFAKGRAEVNKELVELNQTRDVILDRWIAGACAYQACPPATSEDDPFTWHQIRGLNERMGVWYPTSQVIVTCPAHQIPERRKFRQKVGAGTSGQMSNGREDVILTNLLEIYHWFLDKGIPAILIENDGTPVEELRDQVRQAIPTYLCVENQLRNQFEDVIDGFGGLMSTQELTASKAEDIFLDPKFLKNLHERQTQKPNSKNAPIPY